MQIIGAGHIYKMNGLDGGVAQTIQFVKRSGPGYPFNEGEHTGTNCQEVLRVLIDRTKYLLSQVACAETEAALGNLQSALLHFEARAARRHRRFLDCHSLSDLSSAVTCGECGHVGCKGHPIPDELCSLRN